MPYNFVTLPWRNLPSGLCFNIRVYNMALATARSDWDWGIGKQYDITVYIGVHRHVSVQFSCIMQYVLKVTTTYCVYITFISTKDTNIVDSRRVYTSSRARTTSIGDMRCVYIEPSGTKPWWQVDLGASSFVRGVTITSCTKTTGKWL